MPFREARFVTASNSVRLHTPAGFAKRPTVLTPLLFDSTVQKAFVALPRRIRQPSHFNCIIQVSGYQRTHGYGNCLGQFCVYL